MNKYLKTYIRNRNISINSGYRIYGYEIDYVDLSKLNDQAIFNLIKHMRGDDFKKIISLLGDRINIVLSNINENHFYRIFSFMENIDEKVDILILNKIFIKRINEQLLYEMLNKYSKNTDKIKEIVKKYRPDLNID
jgi:hypothetical protein